MMVRGSVSSDGNLLWGREGFFLRPAIKSVDNKDAELFLILLGTLSYKQVNLKYTKVTIY
jgi:hypothetical protein